MHQQKRTRKTGAIPPSTLNLSEGPHANIHGGPQQQPPVPIVMPTPPKCSRFEQLIKSLVGRKVSREVVSSPTPFIPSPEIRITKSPSEHTLIRNDKISSSTASLNSAVQHKLWSVVPLLRREGSCASLHQMKSSPLAHHSGLKKCDTVLALSRSSSNLEPIKPQNRLRNSSSSTITCSRCSSLLSLAANGSRYSLNLSNGGFVAVGGSGEKSTTPKTPSPMQSTVALLLPSIQQQQIVSVITTADSTDATAATIIPADPDAAVAAQHIDTFMCKLCLGEVIVDNLTIITQCGCLFCTDVSKLLNI